MAEFPRSLRTSPARCQTYVALELGAKRRGARCAAARYVCDVEFHSLGAGIRAPRASSRLEQMYLL